MLAAENNGASQDNISLQSPRGDTAGGGKVVSHHLLCKNLSPKAVIGRLVAIAISLWLSLAECGKKVPLFEFIVVGVQEEHSN